MASTVPPDTTSDTPTEALLLTVPSAAKRLAVSTRTVYSLFTSGQLKMLKIGRSTRVAATDLAGFVSNLQSQTK